MFFWSEVRWSRDACKLQLANFGIATLALRLDAECSVAASRSFAHRGDRAAASEVPRETTYPWPPAAEICASADIAEPIAGWQKAPSRDERALRRGT